MALHLGEQGTLKAAVDAVPEQVQTLDLTYTNIYPTVKYLDPFLTDLFLTTLILPTPSLLSLPFAPTVPPLTLSHLRASSWL